MIYDLVIIGGGPAGMMAAARASEKGAHVLILEKNNSLGLKLLTTGNGRCNISNLSPNDKKKMDVYGPGSKFLFSAFNKFDVDSTLNFFANLDLITKIEDNGRVFPQSDRASDVQSALVKYLKGNNVEIRFSAEVKEIIKNNEKIQKVILINKKEVLGKNFLIASGGKSYPGTGSSGDGYLWLKNLGHTVNTPRPALVPIIVKEDIVKELEGASFKDIKLDIYQNNKKLISRLGNIIFTADGLSGPAIIDLSSQIGALLPEKIVLKLDFHPQSEKKEFEAKIQNDFHHSNNKMLKNYLALIAPPKLVPVILKLTGINEEKLISIISREERRRLIDTLKEFTLEIKGLKGFNQAMITAGGVDVKEVNPKTMQSRLYNNLFLAGEILDLDGPSGGYNLQICWSTGYTVGDSIIL